MARALDLGPTLGPAPERFITRFDRMGQRFIVKGGEGYYIAEIEDVKGVFPSGMLWAAQPDEVDRVCTYLWNTGRLSPIPGMERMPDGEIEWEKDIGARRLIVRIGSAFFEADFEAYEALRIDRHLSIAVGRETAVRLVVTLLWEAGILRPHPVPAWLYE